MSLVNSPRFVALCLGLSALLVAVPAMAQTRIRDICRLKGQEENTLQGLGLVVGLKGTGDGDSAPTVRTLATMLSLMKGPIEKGPKGEDILGDLKNAKNVALVFVTATVPPTGARQGDLLNCQVNAIGAKSLDGGHLLLTPLLGPRPGSDRIYAFAQGPLSSDDVSRPNTAKIHSGCRLEEDFINSYIKNGKFTLVLDSNHASFQTAYEVVELINDAGNYKSSSSGNDSKNGITDLVFAKALDAVNIEVQIPERQLSDPVFFISQVLGQRFTINPQNEARVVINQKAGTIAFGGEVEIGAAAVSIKNVDVQTGGAGGPPDGSFVGLDTGAQANPKLKALTDRLNALKVSKEDKIEIIKALERDGKIYARVIVE